MRSLQPRNRSLPAAGRIIGTVCIVIAALLALWHPAWFERLVIETAVSSSFVRTALADGADSVRAGMRSIADVVAENKELREENARLRIQAALYDELRAERNRLYTRFGRDTQARGILAHVLASPTRSPYDTFLVNVGSGDGISQGDEVLFDTTLSIGVVEEVTQHGARVRLFSSPGYENAVSFGTSTALVTAVGRGAGSFELKVPKDMPVAVDDALMLAGTHRGALGFVRSVEARDADAFQTVYAASPINLFETREVLIVTR